MAPSDYKKREVELRAVFLKVGQIDTVKEEYNADIFLQAKWREESLDGLEQNLPEDATSRWNPGLTIENKCTNVKETISREVNFHETASGSRIAYVVEKRRLNGTFNETLELRDFPFDVQDLTITVTTELCSEELELVESTTQHSCVDTSTFADAQEWSLLKHVDVTCYVAYSDYQVGHSLRPAAKCTCQAMRRYGYFVINNIIVSALIGILSFATFSVPRTETHSRLQLAFLLILTTVTYKFVAGHSLPVISYLTYMDKFLFGNLVFLIIMCLWHACISQVPASNKAFTSSEKYFIITMAVVYFIGILIYVFSIYTEAGSRRRKAQLKQDEFKNQLQELEKSAKGNSNGAYQRITLPE